MFKRMFHVQHFGFFCHCEPLDSAGGEPLRFLVPKICRGGIIPALPLERRGRDPRLRHSSRLLTPPLPSPQRRGNRTPSPSRGGLGRGCKSRLPRPLRQAQGPRNDCLLLTPPYPTPYRRGDRTT